MDDYHIVLLRNEARIGVGFMLDWGEFYPDFILWIREQNGNRMDIVFVEPKGLKVVGEVFNHEKVMFLSEGLKEIFKKQYENWQVEVKGFILSTTPHQELRRGQARIKSKEEYEEKNILFLEDRDWAEKFFKRVWHA